MGVFDLRSGACSLTVLVSCSFLGCSSKEEDRPPPINAPGVSGPGAGQNMGGEGPVSPDGEEEDLSGTLFVYQNDTFTATTPYTDAAEITVVAADGTVSTGAASSGSFLIADATLSPEIWLLATPESDLATYPTITSYETGVGTTNGVVPVEHELVPLSVIDGIFLTFSSATFVDPEAAQLLVRVVDELGNGVPGVKAGFASEVITYASGDTWVDQRDSTDDEGMFFIANILSSSNPGQLNDLTLSGAIEAELRVRLMSGAITVVTVTAGP